MNNVLVIFKLVFWKSTSGTFADFVTSTSDIIILTRFNETKSICFTSACSLTCSLHLEVIWQQIVLPVAKREGQQSEEDGVQNADDGQDVGPTHGAVSQAVLVRPLATHGLHLVRVPAVRIDHAAHPHQHACRRKDAETSTEFSCALQCGGIKPVEEVDINVYTTLLKGLWKTFPPLIQPIQHVFIPLVTTFKPHHTS